MTKPFITAEQAARYEELEAEFGSIGDPVSIGGFAQRTKRGRTESLEHQPAPPETPRRAPTRGARSREQVRWLATARCAHP